MELPEKIIIKLCEKNEDILNHKQFLEFFQELGYDLKSEKFLERIVLFEKSGSFKKNSWEFDKK